MLQRENQNRRQLGRDSDIKYAFLSLVLHVFCTGLGAYFYGRFGKTLKAPIFVPFLLHRCKSRYSFCRTHCLKWQLLSLAFGRPSSRIFGGPSPILTSVSWNSSVISSKFPCVTKIRPWSLPFKSFPVHYLQFILTIHAM